MSEVEWSAEGEEAPRKKKRVPSWVWWGCGGGCLLMTLVAVGLVVAGGFAVKRATDPEVQWPKLAEVLAFDERPPNLEIGFGFNLGVRQFHLTDPSKGIYVQITEYPSASADYKRMMDPEFKVIGSLGQPADAELGELEVQGHEVPVLRYSRIKPEPEGGEGLGPGIRVDLTGELGKPRILELRRRGSERVDDEEVLSFLAPFDVWRGRMK